MQTPSHLPQFSKEGAMNYENETQQPVLTADVFELLWLRHGVPEGMVSDWIP